MLRKGLFALLSIFVLIVLYFLAWPVPIEPVAWKVPPNSGYTGPFARNELLKPIEFLKIGTNHGPEDVAVDDQGRNRSEISKEIFSLTVNQCKSIF